MQCNKPYVMTTMVLVFVIILLAILHVTGLKIGENVKHRLGIRLISKWCGMMQL